MRIGIEINQHQLRWEEIVERVRAVEGLGFDGAWVFDHFKPLGDDPKGPCLEAWTLLSALAASTIRIRLGALVTGVTYRHPSVLAAEAVTVDRVSDGRLELGIGAAWFEEEHRQLGIPFPPTRERIERLEEGISVMRLLVTGEDVSFDGKYYQLDGATYRPLPVQRPHPPIWIGAEGERRMLAVVARQADVWHASADLETMIRKSSVLDEHAERCGRDPASIARAGSIRLSERWDDVRRTADGFKEHGFSYLVCVWPQQGLARVEEFAGNVLTELQAL